MVGGCCFAEALMSSGPDRAKEVQPLVVLQTVRDKSRSCEKDRRELLQNVGENLFAILALLHGSEWQASWENQKFNAGVEVYWAEDSDEPTSKSQQNKDMLFANFWSKPESAQSADRRLSGPFDKEEQRDAESQGDGSEMRRTSTDRDMTKDYKFFEVESAGSASEEEPAQVKPPLLQNPVVQRPQLETSAPSAPPKAVAESAAMEAASESEQEEPGPSSRVLRFQEINASLLHSAGPRTPRLSISTLLKRSMFTSISRVFTKPSEEAPPERPQAPQAPAHRQLPQLPRPALPALPATPSSGSSTRDPPSPPSVSLGLNPEFSWRERPALGAAPGAEEASDRRAQFSSEGAGSRPFEGLTLPLMKDYSPKKSSSSGWASEPRDASMSPASLSPMSDQPSAAYSLLQQLQAKGRSASYQLGESDSPCSRFGCAEEDESEFTNPDLDDSMDWSYSPESFGPRPAPIEKEQKKKSESSRDVAINGMRIPHRTARPQTAEAMRPQALVPASPTGPSPESPSPLSRKITEKRIKAAQTSAQLNDPGLSPIMAETLKQTLRRALAREAF